MNINRFVNIIIFALVVVVKEPTFEVSDIQGWFEIKKTTAILRSVKKKKNLRTRLGFVCC